MGKYNGAVITAAGQNLIAQAISGSETVTWTTMQASSYAYPAGTNLEALTALQDVEKTADITSAAVFSSNILQVSARLDNAGVTEPYLINTLGVFAQVGTAAAVLVAVITAVTPDQMPVEDVESPSAFIYNVQMTIQNANQLTITTNPAGTATVEDLNNLSRTVVKYVDLLDLDDIKTGSNLTDKGTSATAMKELLSGFLDMVYPVGSIYLSTNNIDPGNLFGGIWEAFGAADTYLRLGGTGAGGNNSVKLSADQIPTLTTGNQSANHTHSGTTAGQSVNHTHSGTTLSAANNGAHTHEIQQWDNVKLRLGNYTSGVGGAFYGLTPAPNGVADLKAGSAGTHGHSITGNTGNNSVGHTHTITTGNESADHTHTYTNNSQQDVTVEPKYVQTYAWKRTA